MNARRTAVIAAACGAIWLLLSTTISEARSTGGQRVYWVENAGQFDERVRYQLEGARDTVWILDDEIWLTFSGGRAETRGVSGPPREAEAGEALIQNVRITFPGLQGQFAPPKAADSVDLLRTYLTPAGHFPHVPTWRQVQLYAEDAGVALTAFTADGGLLLELEAPADLDAIEVLIEGADGLQVLDNGLMIESAFGSRALPIHVSSGSPALIALDPSGRRVEFRPPARAASADPAAVQAVGAVEIGTYYGVTGQLEFGSEIIAGEAGVSYTAGSAEAPITAFSDRPGLQVPLHLVAAFVVKLNAAGTAAEYLTTITGLDPNGEDYALDLAGDDDGHIYVTGLTSSDDFPTTPGAFDETHNGGENDAWLARLDASGAVVFSTLIGSGGNDWSNAVALGPGGEIYITGFTSGPGFPKTGAAYDPSHNGGFDAFVTRLSADGSALLTGTFLGGTANEGGDFNLDRSDIHVDPTGAAVVIGPTSSANFPITGPVIGPGGCKDIYITGLTPTLSALNFSARIGGSGTSCGFNGDDNPERLVVFEDGRIFITGYTSSSQAQGFPVTPGAFDTTYGGSFDGFVLGFDPDAYSVNYAAYLGAESIDVGKDVAIAAGGILEFTGYTFSTGFPVCDYAFDPVKSGDSDAFFIRLAPGKRGPADLLYSTFLGGSSRDWGVGLEDTGDGAAFLTGLSASTNFPVSPGAFQPGRSGDQDAFIALLSYTFTGAPFAGPTPTAAPFVLQLPVAMHAEPCQ